MNNITSSKQNQSFIINKLKTFWYKILNLHKTNTEVGLCHYYMDNLFDAIMRFKLILKFYPNDIEAKYNLGRCYMKKNKFDKAFKIFKNLSDKHNMAKYQWEKSIDTSKITNIPTEIITEAAHHITTYRLYHDKKDKSLHTLIINIISNYQNIEKKLNILHINCGIGEIGIFLKKSNIECNIFGMDITPVAITHCEKLWLHKYGKIYKETQIKSIAKILEPTALQYNVVICIERISYNSNLEKILKKFKKLLQQNSILILALFDTNNNNIELNEINDYFQFNQQYVKDTAEKNNLKVLEIHNNKGNFSNIHNHSTLYVMQ